MARPFLRLIAPFESRLRLILLGLLLATLLLQGITALVLKTTHDATERALLSPLYESLDRMQVRAEPIPWQTVATARTGGEVTTRFRLEDTVEATVRSAWLRIPEVARRRLLAGKSAQVKSTSDRSVHWQVARICPDSASHVVIMASRGFDSIGRLDELQSWHTAGQIVALGFLLLAVILVARELSRPFERLRHVARTARENLPEGESPDEGEWDEIVDTFKATIERLRESEAHLKQRFESSEVERLHLQDFSARMIDALPQPLVAFDATGRVVRFNPAACALPGLPAPRTGDDARAWLSEVPWTHVLAPTDPSGGEIVLHVDDERFHFGHERIPLHDGGTLLLLHDRTPVRRLEALLASRARLAALGETAAGLAHELRNAMGAIVGYARLSEKSGEGALEIHTRILKEARAMEEMLNRFLEVARPTEPQRAILCVEDVVTEALQPFAQRYQEAGVRLEWNPQTSTTVSIDAFWLRQAIVNLLENALSFVPRGGRVQVDSRRLEGVWRLSIQDDGPGILPELREKVLLPFVSMRPGGTGLGLALVSKIVTAHDGRVEVLESAWGGARFDLLFPCGPQTAASPGTAPGWAASPRPETART